MKNLFVTFSLFTLSILLLPVTLSAQEPGEPLFTEDIGVQMYSFRNIIPEIGLEATLDAIRDMGITEIEGGPGEDMSPEEYRRLVEERGLGIPSTGAGFEQLADDPEGVAERAKALGSNYVMNSWISHEVGNFNYENARRAVEVFNHAGQILSEHGLTLKYHLHGYEMQPHEDGTLLDYIIQNTHPEHVSFQLDIFWAHFGGADPAELLETYGDRFVSLHVKDMQKGIEKDLTGLTDPEYDVVLGTGQLDMPAIMKAAKAAGVKHYFIEDESSRVMEQIPASIEYLRSLKE
ncbi:MAG: sugar phosphate isomerase/epimerase [Balneolaceae bacterium]